jgi:hypothetical protein
LLLLCFSPAGSQERSPHQLIVPLSNGGYVAFKAETAFAETKKASDQQQARAVFDSQALIDDKQVIHRLLVDADGKPVFGYDLSVSGNSDLRQFTVTARPLDQQFESRLSARTGSRQPEKIATLPRSSESQVLDDGDAFTLDLLVNPDSGIKIVDIVKVSFDRANLWDNNPRSLPRDFTLDAVQMTVREYQLLRNGKTIASSKSTTGCSGTLIWVYVPDRGRYIFSLVPRVGYQFQKVGFVASNKIEFSIGKDRYEWISSVPVLNDSGAWNLWVLHEPKYVPLIPPLELGARKEKQKDAWDKLNEAVKSVQDDAARIRNQGPATYQKDVDKDKDRNNAKFSAKPRVMIGSADSMENLWPR